MQVELQANIDCEKESKWLCESLNSVYLYLQTLKEKQFSSDLLMSIDLTWRYTNNTVCYYLSHVILLVNQAWGNMVGGKLPEHLLRQRRE